MFTVLLLPGVPISVIGLAALPWQARGAALRPVVLLSVITFLATSLLFPVATTWGTFLHAAGPVQVLIVLSALLALDAGIARLGRRLGWTNPVAWLGPALGIFGSALFSVVLLSGFGGGARETAAQFAELERRMAAIGHPLDATAGPVLTNYPIWLAETSRIPSLALPDESPSDVLDLARDPAFAGHAPRHPRRRRARAVAGRPRHGRAGRGLLPGAGPRTRSGRRARSTQGDACLRDRLSMRGDPYTQSPMEPARAGTDARDSRFDGLHAEAKAAVGYSANTLRSVRERYREAYSDSLTDWQALRDELDAQDRGTNDLARARSTTAPVDRAADAAEAGADDFRRRALRSDVETLTIDLGERQSELAKLELAERSLERTWLFLERGDATLITEVGPPASEGDAQMRIVEAQEAERSRLAQEVHDGPAQALANSIFQVEYIERVIESDPLLARTELRFLRELLRRELGDVRAFISQLRPPMLDHLGLDGAIDDTVEHMRALTGLEITTDLAASADGLNDAQRTVALRVAQEALQNVRKHAAATKVTVATHDEQAGEWVLEVRDDGRGFDVGAVAARGRRNFGLQFMRERAELIGARLDVRSRPEGGTVVRLTIPAGDAIGGEEST